MTITNMNWFAIFQMYSGKKQDFLTIFILTKGKVHHINSLPSVPDYNYFIEYKGFFSKDGNRQSFLACSIET